MNRYREENSYCYSHPKHVLVGVCALCLNERLLLLASNRNRRITHHNNDNPHFSSLPKFFAFSSLLNLLESRHRKPENSDHEVSTSREDSFISIKFEENGVAVASWEKKNKVSSNKVSLENCIISSWTHNLTSKGASKQTNTKTMIEHQKPRDSLRWRKRIGNLFQLIRWKRYSNSSVCHVGSKVEAARVIVRKDWIRTGSRHCEKLKRTII